MKRHDFYEYRKYPILIIICGAFLLIIIKLFFIQIIDKSYKLSAENNIIRKIVKYPERGWIYDRNQKLLVSNQRAHDIMVVPYQLTSSIDTLFLCKILGISKSDFIQKMKNAKRNSNYKPSVFLKNMSKDKFADIQEYLHLFKGFYAQTRYVRAYNTASGGNIFGYTSQISIQQLKKNPSYNKNDVIGATGIEKVYETILKGEKGVERKVVDVFGKYQGVFENGKYDTLPKKGKDITLTIDINLQEYAEVLMKNKKGSVVAIEPKTGEILCLLSSPSYDPVMFIGEERSKNFRSLFLDPSKPLYNRSTSALYPPGSIFKIINALIGLQERVINPGTLIKCKTGWNYKSILNIGCHEHPSPLNLRQAIAQSCNAYFCELFTKTINIYKDPSISLNHWQKHVESFGLNQVFQNDLYNEKKGCIPDGKHYDNLYGKKRWGASTCISLGIGQDALLMTPIQMANLAAIIANRGYYKTPHLIKSENKNFINYDLESHQYCSIDSIYFNYIVYGMQTAIEGQYGTAQSAKLNEITICGKTGTAQNPHGKDHSIFIAFAPKKNPQIALVVYVENGGWGSELAAPLGSLCIEKYLFGKTNRSTLEEKIINTHIKY